jgi:hypothetical protein
MRVLVEMGRLENATQKRSKGKLGWLQLVIMVKFDSLA